MNGDEKKGPKSAGLDRTVFMPSGSGIPDPSSAPPQGTAPEPEQERKEPPIAPPAATSLPPDGSGLSSRPSAIKPGSFGQDVGSGSSQIQIGDVLNHIFEVKRFIARGGMGEVFEGINVNSDERVAIKVMLPALAADANVLAMFRKEARTLTRLSHPALVQYRVLAQEPQLGVFYIVTEFVDGQNLSDVIGELDASPHDLRNLLKRLAEGLSAAHALGAIHRDIAPDNVMLEGGKLSGAKIIDFGIAKDLDPGSATIIGDGFAGKLNYVAPEQLGDFGRSIGPWTDVYSLGLLILAVAQRKDVDMGGTLVNAVDKRRAGPDLSVAPDELRPLLAKMVRANPEERPRSMGEVLELLRSHLRVAQPPPPVEVAPPVPAFPATEEAVAPKAPPAAPPPVEVKEEPTIESLATPAAEGEAEERSKLPLIAGGVAAVVALAGVLAWQFGGSGSKAPDASEREATAANVSASQAAPKLAAGELLTKGLPAVNCTWLDPAEITETPDGVKVAFRGVAGNPAVAQGAIGRIFEANKVRVAALDFQEVSPIETNACGAMDAARQIRNPAGARMSIPQRIFEMSRMDAGPYAGSVAAKAVVNFNLADPNTEVSLFGIEPSGKIDQITRERAELLGVSENLGNGQHRLTLEIDHTGWSGLLLVSGQKPFDAELLTVANRGGAAAQRFLDIAKQRNWRTEMVWFKTIDDQPN